MEFQNSLVKSLAGELGFEPRQAESESAVLPLDDSPMPRRERLVLNAPCAGGHDMPVHIDQCISTQSRPGKTVLAGLKTWLLTHSADDGGDNRAMRAGFGSRSFPPKRADPARPGRETASRSGRIRALRRE